MWRNRTVAVVATGPSLTASDADLLARRRKSGTDDFRVLAVNDAYRLLPDADLLYACDEKWWRAHDGVRHFAGERWTQSTNRGLECAARFGLRVVESVPGARPSDDPARIAQGHNSGFQAVNLAVLAGASRIILVGFDMNSPGGRKHFFGDHVGESLNVAPAFHLFIQAFNAAAPVYAARGIEIVNASRSSALSCFPRLDLERVLSC